MNAVFVVKGRLGNAIFRYLGCTIFAIKYNLNYLNYNNNQKLLQNGTQINDAAFRQFIEADKKNICLPLPNFQNYQFSGFYQHDNIYIKYKKQILNYIQNHKNKHFVTTDGINPGDGNFQNFYLKDIIDTPINFNKFYDFVLHIRLGDKVKLRQTLSIEAIKNLIKKIEIPSNSCIVVNTPKNEYENNFLDEIVKYITKTKQIKINIESNDIITDFHIMKNAKILACSVSTISWCAAYFSKRIKKCYMPDCPKEVNSCGYCKKPIDNTELYNYN